MGAALPSGSEAFPRGPFHHVRTETEGASPHQTPSLVAPGSGLVSLPKCEKSRPALGAAPFTGALL